MAHGRPPALKPVTDPESWNGFEQSHLKTDEPNRALNGRSTRGSSSRTRKRSARHKQQRHLELIPVQLRKWCQRERGNLERAAPVLGIDQSGGINLPTRAAGTTQNAGVELVSLAWVGHAAAGTGGYGVVHLSGDALHLLTSAFWPGALVPLATFLFVLPYH